MSRIKLKIINQEPIELLEVVAGSEWGGRGLHGGKVQVQVNSLTSTITSTGEQHNMCKSNQVQVNNLTSTSSIRK